MIISKQNSLIKEARSLKNKKFRDTLNRYVVEGVKMVNEAFKFNQKVLYVISTESCLTKLNVGGFPVELCSEEVYASITDEKNPQGVLAVIEKPTGLKLPPNDQSALLLDGVSDPGNLGTIIRTMVGAGYKNLFLTGDCADVFSPKVVRSSMSGIYHVNIFCLEREQAREQISLPIIIADMRGEDVFKLTPPKNFCLVIGNEAHGVSNEIREIADLCVKIPMKQEMESLNAGISAGILMYALKNRI